MYFDPAPKTDKKDLFGFNEECKELENAIEQYGLIAIRGLRRTGKTSLMNAVYNNTKHLKSFVDAREIERGKKPAYEYFGRLFYNVLKEASIVERIKSHVKGLDSYVQLTFRGEQGLSELAKRINKMMEEKNGVYCIFIDEAQLLKPTGFDNFLAFVYDRLKRIKIILAGSEVGILDRFIGSEAGGALYGRAKKTINIRRFEHEKSAAFLRAGFRQLRIATKEEEIDDAINRLDGIVGWLAYYGFYRKELPHKDAVMKTVEDGSKIIAAELRQFLENRIAAKARYKLILGAISSMPLSWQEIKNLVMAKSGRQIADSRLSNLLSQLKKYGFIEEKDGKYALGDPLIKDALRML